jgi:hypothetical protein
VFGGKGGGGVQAKHEEATVVEQQLLCWQLH